MKMQCDRHGIVEAHPFENSSTMVCPGCLYAATKPVKVVEKAKPVEAPKVEAPKPEVKVEPPKPAPKTEPKPELKPQAKVEVKVEPQKIQPKEIKVQLKSKPEGDK